MKASLRQRRIVFAAIASVSMPVTVSLAIKMPKAVFWNASASVPVGLYVGRPASELAIGDLVLVRPPKRIARFAVARGYLGPDVPMLKHVAALGGALVCRNGAVVSVGDMRVLARTNDRHGRELPSWSGCRTVRADEVFLLNSTAPDSLDGRYFGPFSRDTVIARAVLVWRLDNTR